MSDQLSREDLASMSPEDISAAYLAGRLDAILGRATDAGQVLDSMKGSTDADD
ncbi:hypothetical protein ACG5V6_12470 [Streptomyces chitinivorans]|uniref:FXSXX-COOH protein n=1 Tax=Streptomyces chitinivorans TaxID=1257027 RepID=A0ABW7HT05_9ACTN|nr:hypothetical protein [Streptomyces chitinivorans]MDH2409623.1 hypothetical protein [Streptomyces chitinivorans]